MDKISVWEFDGHSPQFEPVSVEEFLTSASSSFMNNYINSFVPEEPSVSEESTE